MIYRKMYRGYWETKNITIKEADGVENVSAAFFGDMIFMYFETEREDISPEAVLSDGLKSFPDGRKWENMSEIFHYSKPLSREHWERKEKKTPLWRFNALKPEGISKYIYYHFQYQEEYPGDGDKYGIIFNIENIIVMYLEAPEAAETEKIPGMLNTKNSPRHEAWQQIMGGLFKPDENGTVGWKVMENVKWSN